MEAVLDRIVDGNYAVLLVGDKEEERVVSVIQLPEGAKEGMKYKLTFEDDAIVAIEAMIETSRLSSETSERLASLRNRQASRFKR